MSYREGMARNWERLGYYVRTHAGKLGWTQAEIARHAGVNVDTVNDLVNGKEYKRLPTTLFKITGALGWSTDLTMAVLDEGVSPFGQEDRPRRNLAEALVEAEGIRQDEPPLRAPRASEVAALVRQVQALRSAVENLPLGQQDRQRFLFELGIYEEKLTDALDRASDVEDAG